MTIGTDLVAKTAYTAGNNFIITSLTLYIVFKKSTGAYDIIYINDTLSFVTSAGATDNIGVITA